MRILPTALSFVLGLLASAALAQDAKTVEKLAFGDSDERVEAVAALVAAGDEKSAALLQALADGELYTAGKRVLIVRGAGAVDAATGAKVAPLPEDREEITVNNRLRRELGRALAALKLVSPGRDARFAAARELAGGAEPAMLPLVKKALATETDSAVKPLLEQIAAALELKAGDREARLAAVRKLAASHSPNTKTLLLSFLEAEKDEDLRIEAQKSLREIEGRLAWGERAGIVFTSISLGSILLLAAL